MQENIDQIKAREAKMNKHSNYQQQQQKLLKSILKKFFRNNLIYEKVQGIIQENGKLKIIFEHQECLVNLSDAEKVDIQKVN